MKPFERVSMSKPLLTSLAAVLILLSGAALMQAGSQDFTLVNHTGLTIQELYISPTKSAEWGGDVLGVSVLESGDQTDITFPPGAGARVWDLMIVDEEGEKITWGSLRLNEISEITLYYRNGTATAGFN